MLGVTTGTPSQWERGHSNMPVGLWELLNIKARVIMHRIGYV